MMGDGFILGHPLGWTTALWITLITVVILLCNQRRTHTHIFAVLCLLQCISLVYAFSADKLFIVSVGLILLSLHYCLPTSNIPGALQWLRCIVRFLLSPFHRILSDVACRHWVARKRQSQFSVDIIFRTWMLPIACTATFIILFGYANPVWELWLNWMDWELAYNKISQLFSAARICFYLCIIPMLWYCIRPRVRFKIQPSTQSPYPRNRPFEGLASYFFSQASVMRSLALFNLLFAIQTLLDLSYLWGGVTLPQGLTYASYAHRGAYPLVVTALLAGVFALICLRSDSNVAHQSRIRTLLYLWMAQNILLVMSALWRTWLYIEEYSLTHLRIAALLWMVLVSVGLILIIIRMYYNYSSTWLINSNAVSLCVMLYLCSFIDISHTIADYNVRHCKEVTGKGAYLDIQYVGDLGPSALEPLQWYIKHAHLGTTRLNQSRKRTARKYHWKLIKELKIQTNNWRSFTVKRYLLRKQFLSIEGQRKMYNQWTID